MNQYIFINYILRIIIENNYIINNDVDNSKHDHEIKRKLTKV